MPPDGSTSFLLPDALAVCRDSALVPSTGTGTDPLCSADSNAVSYANEVAPVLAGCSGEICHAPWTYDTLVGQPSRACCDHRLLVAPGLPSQSHVVQAIMGTTACVPRMPLDLAPLSDAQIATLVAWVCQGAPNN